jgi:EpsI family protein
MTMRVAVVFALLLAAAAGVARADRQENIPLRRPFAVFPMQMGDWRGVAQPPLTDDVLAILGLDDYLTRAYVTPDRTAVGLYVGYWQSQRQGDAMHSPANCLPGAGWEPVSQGIMQVTDPRNPAGPKLGVNRYVIQKGLDRQLVLYWYQSHGRVIGSEYWSKIYMVADAVRLNRTDAALVRVITEIKGEDAAAESKAESQAIAFMNELMPRLSAFLPD